MFNHGHRIFTTNDILKPNTLSPLRASHNSHNCVCLNSALTSACQVRMKKLSRRNSISIIKKGVRSLGEIAPVTIFLSFGIQGDVGKKMKEINRFPKTSFCTTDRMIDFQEQIMRVKLTKW